MRLVTWIIVLHVDEINETKLISHSSSMLLETIPHFTNEHLQIVVFVQLAKIHLHIFHLDRAIGN